MARGDRALTSPERGRLGRGCGGRRCGTDAVGRGAWSSGVRGAPPCHPRWDAKEIQRNARTAWGWEVRSKGRGSRLFSRDDQAPPAPWPGAREEEMLAKAWHLPWVKSGRGLRAVGFLREALGGAYPPPHPATCHPTSLSCAYLRGSGTVSPPPRHLNTADLGSPGLRGERGPGAHKEVRDIEYRGNIESDQEPSSHYLPRPRGTAWSPEKAGALAKGVSPTPPQPLLSP